MTRKQRAKIYRQAAEMICDKQHIWCCDAIAEASAICDIYEKVDEQVYPEFFMFKFKRDGHVLFWNDYVSPCNETECRILALLLSEQMALNP